MATVTWGMLEKSQADPETIEEAIARLILVHGEDETSHLGAGESLQSHKASLIIDHIARSIVTDKIALLAVTVAELGNQAVETAKVKDLNITEGKIGSLAVTEAKIGNLAVVEGKVKDLAITNAKIANTTIETGKIKDLAVTNAKIANTTIEEAKIKDLAVTDAKIANATITDAKISDLTVEKLTGTYLTGKVVRTSASGQRVEMRGANNDIAFYDSGGNLGGTIIGQSSKIYISGAGLEIECPLSMEAELIIDTTRSVIPTDSNTYHLGGSSYNWDHLYLNALYHGAQQIIDFSGNYLDLWRPLIYFSGALNEGGEGSKGMVYVKGSDPSEELRVYLNGGWRTIQVV